MKTKLLAFFGAVDLLASRVAHALMTWLFWPVFLGVAAGSGIWAIIHRSRLPQVDTNKLAEPEFMKALFWVIGACAVIATLYSVAAIVRKRAAPGGFFSGSADDVAKRLAPLVALPFVAVLALPNIERDSPKQTLFFITIAAIAVTCGAYAWARAPRPDAPGGDDAPPRRQRRQRVYAIVFAVLVAAVWAAYGWFFSKLSITNHHALNTRTTDLGYYDNIFYQTLHGHLLGCSFIRAGYHGSAHFDPILILLSPIYLVYPHAETLLVLQSVWVGAGVVPVYLIARHKGLSRPGALALAAAYALCPALQGANMYEFHSLTLLATPLLWLIYFAETQSRGWYYVLLGPTLLCREDVPLILCFFSLTLMLSERRGDSRMGWITAIISLIYFVVVKKFFMTSSDIFMSNKESYSYAYYYEDLIPNHNGIGGMLLSLATNPAFAIKTMFIEAKVQYILILYLPLLFLPFLAKRARVSMVYGLLFCLLATRVPVFQPHFQYSCVLIPFMFALTPMALDRIKVSGLVAQLGWSGERLAKGLVAGCFVASLLVCWKFGGIIDNQSFRGGFGRVTRTLSDTEKATYAWVSEQAAAIPINAVVGTTNKMGCHVSNRKTVYFWPLRTDVEWVFLDESELGGNDLERHTKLSTTQFTLVSRNGKMAVFHKK